MLIHKSSTDIGVVFAVQSTGITSYNAFEALKGLEDQTVYEFGIIPFSTEITGIADFPNNDIVVPLGGTKLITMDEERHLPPNWTLFYHDVGFRYHHCVRMQEQRMLNWDNEYATLGETLDRTFREDVFIKPDDDRKMFTGFVVSAGLTLRQELGQQMHQELVDSAPIIISPVKKILAEYRVVVSFNRIVGISQYQKNGRLEPAAVTDMDTILRISQFVGEAHSRFYPADVYVIDVADVPSSWQHRHPMKIVEYNCFNCSGLYKIDRKQMYNAIHRDLVEYWR